MIIKSSDGRGADIVALERLLERPDVPQATRKRIEAEIRQIQSGEKGERDAAYIIDLYLGRSPNWAVIHDLRIEIDGHAAQIDHLIINRLAQMWVCESKHFAEGVSVNEYGEWLRWWHGRPDGIPSPIEQNARHILLLDRAFDDGLVKAPKRLGLVRWKPELRSLVLVSDNARIGRPKSKSLAPAEVIKAEQLKKRLIEEFDRAPDRKVLGIIGKEGLETFARELVALHRPASVNWSARFGLAQAAVEPPVAEPGPAAAPTASPTPRAVSRQGWSGGQCARCERAVSDAVVRYCEEHGVEFGGAIYCMRCQPVVRARAERQPPVPAWSTVLARYHAPTRLRTVARQAPFIVVANGQDLRIVPESSTRGRTLTRADFERTAPLLIDPGRAEVNDASRNSSYVEAILVDLGS